VIFVIRSLRRKFICRIIKICILAKDHTCVTSQDVANHFNINPDCPLTRSTTMESTLPSKKDNLRIPRNSKIKVLKLVNKTKLFKLNGAKNKRLKICHDQPKSHRSSMFQKNLHQGSLRPYLTSQCTLIIL
jgi:hypothetical protein